MEALVPSHAINRARVHIYVPVDPRLMSASLGVLADNKVAIIKMAEKLVKLAKESGYEVEFSPEGYSKQEDNFGFVTDLICGVVGAGATIINCPDTIGGASRYQGNDYFVNKMIEHKAIIDRVIPENKVIWSVHCHNDFGLALENSITGVFSGVATQIEGCLNGVGERAGNVALEQCVMFIREFGSKEHLPQKFYTNIDTRYFQEASDFIAQRMLPRQPHLPIIGENAATHTSGGHTNAIIKNPLSYQPFDPKDVGREISFVFSALSGSNHAKDIINRFGYVCLDEEKTIITQFIKDYYHDRRKGITDEELLGAYKMYHAPIKVTHISYTKDTNDLVSVKMVGDFFGNQDTVIKYKGNGSALSALNRAVNEQMKSLVTVLDYRSNSRGTTVEAVAISEVTIEVQGHVLIGFAEDTDIEISALKGFIDAVNKAYVDINYKN
jgi:2-isopropylmalate synthase